MDTAKLCLTLLCICGSWSLASQVKCDLTTEYEFNGRCCKACPSGEYPKEQCQGNHTASVCEKCSYMGRCFCQDNYLCRDNKCDSCESKLKCKPGEQLTRYGKFDHIYLCEPCPNNTYNDAEDSTCKPITKIICDGVDELFPGNQTHNAICLHSGGRTSISKDGVTHRPAHISAVTHKPAHTGAVTHRPTPGTSTENGNQYTHSFMVACLIVTVLTFLVFFMYTAFQIFKYKMLTKLRKPCIHALPSDICSYKLSKEEMGEQANSKTEVPEENRKFDVNSFP
ncbi:tumor necrosis factor receptor superfamily member 18 [Pseudorasbora parva]|uniref:tumor necrosis factor receptor superfamily member 18 n=1 Tax=Pseudorasbora parva TaxID=51549 RepID=UPI00351DC984